MPININIKYQDGSSNQYEFGENLSDEELTTVFDFVGKLLSSKVRSIHPDGEVSKEIKG